MEDFRQTDSVNSDYHGVYHLRLRRGLRLLFLSIGATEAKSFISPTEFFLYNSCNETASSSASWTFHVVRAMCISGENAPFDGYADAILSRSDLQHLL